MAGRRLGALEGGELPPFQCIPGDVLNEVKTPCNTSVAVKSLMPLTARRGSRWATPHEGEPSEGGRGGGGVLLLPKEFIRKPHRPKPSIVAVSAAAVDSKS